MTSTVSTSTVCPQHGVDVKEDGYALDADRRWLRCPGGPSKCLFTRTR